MSQPFVSSESFPNFHLWDKIKDKRVLLSFDLEITARAIMIAAIAISTFQQAT
jgi:hypothetical protein